jgi:flavorubredoxin
MSFTIKEGITWVGKIDWELKKFHGEGHSTHRGSSNILTWSGTKRPL